MGALAIVVLSLVLANYIWERVVPGAAIAPRTADMRPVRMSIVNSEGKGLRLKIPKAYILDRKNMDGGAQSSAVLGIFVIAGSYRPPLVPADGESEKSSDVAASGDSRKYEVRIWLQSCCFAEDHMKKKISHAVKVYNVKMPDANGLEHYRNEVGPLHDAQGKLVAEKATARTEIYVTPAESSTNAPVYYACTIPSDPEPAPNCQSELVYLRHNLKYIFPASEIARWKEIDETVRAFLDGLVEAELK